MKSKTKIRIRPGTKTVWFKTMDFSDTSSNLAIEYLEKMRLKWEKEAVRKSQIVNYDPDDIELWS